MNDPQRTHVGTVGRHRHTPEQVGGPDNGQVLDVHAGLSAAGGQTSQVSNEVLQGPERERKTTLVHNLGWLCIPVVSVSMAVLCVYQ